MKKLLLATAFGAVSAVGSAHAADMPAYRAPPAPAYFSWTGFYLGAHVGYGWRESDTTIVTQNGTPPFNFPIGSTQDKLKTSGAIGGGQVGFNYQIGQWVWGLEADASASDVSGNRTTTSLINQNVLSTTAARENWLSTAAVRLGYAVDRNLYYVKGGAAWSHQETESVTSLVPPGSPPGVRTISRGSDDRTGWLIGFGTEIAAPGAYSNWSLKIESNYIDYGTKRVERVQTFAFSPAQGAVGDVSLRDNKSHETTFKVGVNYRFGSYGAVYANY
jgi:outer membrane immunogenic protein